MESTIDEMPDFEKRVRRSLDTLIETFRAAIHTDSSQMRLSVSSFARYYRIPRSVLYRDHRHLVTEIEAVFRSLEEERTQFKKENKRPSYNELRAENASLRRQLKYERADLTSRQLTLILKQAGPMFRSRQVAMMEKQALERTIIELEERIARRDDLIYSLTMQLNRSPPDSQK